MSKKKKINKDKFFRCYFNFNELLIIEHSLDNRLQNRQKQIENEPVNSKDLELLKGVLAHEKSLYMIISNRIDEIRNCYEVE